MMFLIPKPELEWEPEKCDDVLTRFARSRTTPLPEEGKIIVISNPI